jgi:hypothetical protein
MKISGTQYPAGAVFTFLFARDTLASAVKLANNRVTGRVTSLFKRARPVSEIPTIRLLTAQKALIPQFETARVPPLIEFAATLSNA